MLNMLHAFYKPISLFLLVALGLSCGHLIDTVLEINLRSAIQSKARTVSPPPLKSGQNIKTDLNLILKNNIFDIGSRFANAPLVSETDASNGRASEGYAANSSVKLFGTVVAAEKSQTLLKVNKDLQLYHLGDELPGGGVIEEIRRNQVNIRNRDKSLSTLMLHEEDALQKSSLAPQVDKVRNSQENIREVGQNRWLISRNTIESVRENFADQLRLAQMHPRIVNGKTDGFMIRRINQRSLLNKLGLMRGDVIVDVNNIMLDSPEKALQIFQQLREARQISINIERSGQPMNFEYEIN